MKILVTGAAGFLGSNLSMHLIRMGHDVIGVDNFASSDRKSRHLESLCDSHWFSFIEGDITERSTLTSIKCDLILNFACIASPPRYQAQPLETLDTSTIGVRNVLGLAHALRVPIVHASTSEVYGDPDVSPQPETYWGRVNSFGPRACYDEGKRCAEAYCYEYSRVMGVDVRIVRIFNTYGPNMYPYDGRVISNFINQALADDPITIHGDGKQTRSFCYVDDLVRGVVALAMHPTKVTTPVNMGNPIELPIKEIAERIIEKLPETKSHVVHVDRPGDDPSNRRPDIACAYHILGWQPRVCLDAGLDATITYFKSLRK